MLCIDIMKNAGTISDGQWNFLLRGPVGAKGVYPKKPDVSTLSENMWTFSIYMSQTFPTFSGLMDDILTIINITIGDFSHVRITVKKF